MADNTKYGNAVEFDVDIHSIYAAYIGLFESSNIDWWDKSWGGYFTTFGDFLGFGWEVMIIVDSDTGRPHIAVRREQIALFARMIKTRFGESLPKDPPTTLPLRPVSTRTLALRRLVTLTDLAAYRKLALTLPAAELNYLRLRVRNAEVGVAEQLFYAGDNERRTAGVRDNGVGYTWACISTTWWEKGGPASGLVPGIGHTRGKGKGLVLEVGMAVVRCANLRAVNVWPPVPQENYRKSHFITEEWVDKRANTSPPNYPRAYAFGRSRYVAEKEIEKIVDATVGALASQENDSNPNTLILLTVGDPPPLPVPSASTLPSNILHLDVLALEYRLLRRAQEQGIPGTPDRHHPLPSLSALLQILQIPVPHFAPLGNAGNDAFYTVLAFQKLMMAETRLPDLLFGQGQPLPDYQMSAYMPPAAPFARPDQSRRSSGNSHRGSSYFAESISRPLQESPRRRSESSRPLFIGDPARASVISINRPSTPETTRQIGSAPSTILQTNTRAQTVCWDDSEYAPPSPITARPALKNSTTSLTDDRGRPAPVKRQIPMSASSRSISWGADTPLEPPDRTILGARTRSSASSPIRPPQGTSNSTLSKDGSSSTKLSLESGSGSSAEKVEKDKGDKLGVDQKNKGKLKNEKSVKDLAGALARFWVG